LPRFVVVRLHCVEALGCALLLDHRLDDSERGGGIDVEVVLGVAGLLGPEVPSCRELGVVRGRDTLVTGAVVIAHVACLDVAHHLVPESVERTYG